MANHPYTASSRSPLHRSTSSISSSISPGLPGADRMMGGPGGSSGSRHRPSGSMDRSQYPTGASYSSADIPSSPSIGISNSNFPAGYHGAGYGQRGVKHTGVGMGIMGLSRPFDDNASVSSLLMDRDTSYDHHSDSGHTYSTHDQHNSLSASTLGLPMLTSEMGKRTLREKTSFTHLKNSDHKILSNEEKYNAYVVPGVQQYDGPEPDDALHDPGPRLKGSGPDRRLGDSNFIHGSTRFLTWRGWQNVIGIACIILPLIGLFAAYPIIQYVIRITSGASSSVYTNSTGQVPDIPNFRGLIDRDTPIEVYTKTGQDGLDYTLVFSDEFETPGRSFYPGDDPYWTALDMHYYSTNDVEYYDPQSVTTAGGNLVLNLTKVANKNLNHDLGYMSGMLQSWNQFCFTGGIVEARVSLPGRTGVTGLWPAFWTMGNLGRAGYGSTLEGTWPFSYDSCDSGALPNQTDFSKRTTAWETSDGNPLSYLPGQKLSACTCKGEDHPGPSHDVGRSAPELDVFEALINVADFHGQISQTLQVAPFDMDWLWPNTSSTFSVTDKYNTDLNAYHGSFYQQSCSALSDTDQESYYLNERNSFQTYSYEYQPSSGTNYDGYVHWLQNGTVTWSMQESGLAGNQSMDLSQRLLPREPMYMIMNLGMAENFNPIDYADLTFPAIMRFDYVRVYQQTGQVNVGCDPKDYPTADYINRHINAYDNYNLTVWADAEPSGFPKNSLLGEC